MILAQYKVDEGSGATLADSSGNGNDATVTDITTFWDDAQVAQAVQDMDAAHLTLSDIDGHALPSNLAALKLLCNTNDQYFHNEACGGDLEFTFYKTVQTGDDLLAIKAANCLL